MVLITHKNTIKIQMMFVRSFFLASHLNAELRFVATVTTGGRVKLVPTV